MTSPRLASLLCLSLGTFSHGCDRAGTSDGAGPGAEQVVVEEGAHRLAMAPDKLPEPVAMSAKATGQLGPGRGTLIVDIRAPQGAKLTEGAPFRVSATGADLTFPVAIDTRLDLKDLPARLPLDVADGAQGPLELDLTYYYCTTGADGSCRPERAKLAVEVDLNGGAPGGELHVIHSPST